MYSELLMHKSVLRVAESTPPNVVGAPNTCMIHKSENLAPQLESISTTLNTNMVQFNSQCTPQANMQTSNLFAHSVGLESTSGSPSVSKTLTAAQ